MNCLKLNNNQTDQERWFNLLSNSINGNYLSSIPYLDIYRSKGWDVISYLYEENQKDVAGVHFLTRSYLKKTFKIASINSGFIFLGEPAKVLFDKLLTHFLEWAESRNAVFLRINPRVPQLINGNEIPYSKMIHNLLVSNGFRPLKNEDYTYWIDLHLSEDELLKRMKKQTRYEVRKGLKSKIEVERYDSFNQEIFLKFWELYSTLGKMKEFSTMSRQEFYLLIKSLLDFELASLFVLIYEQKIINISLCAKVNIGA